MHLETLDEWFADLPDELIHIVMEYCDARSLATLSATASWLSPPAHEWATKKAMERGYAFAPGSKVTAGRLAVLESHEEAALSLRDTYINALGERRFVDSSTALHKLLSLDPMVLVRKGSVPQSLILDPAYRSYTLYLLPCLGQSPLWEAHAADIASVYNDSDPGVRSTALLALREVTKRMPVHEMEVHAPTFVAALEDEYEFVRLAAVASMQRLSPTTIARHEARLRRMSEDEAERERIRQLARHTLERAGLGLMEVA